MNKDYLSIKDADFYHFPKYVGRLHIIDLHVSMYKKPSRWCLWWMKVLLGWTWEDLQ